ncbi:MAG: DUF3488 and transglutaminase-like domain-containing protein [Planctomycetota bacterium]
MSDFNNTLPEFDRQGASVVPRPEIKFMRRRTMFCFAVLTALGGAIIGTSEQTADLKWIALLFACIGFIAVDWLRVFSLPPVLAYAAMAVIAVYGVGNFMGDDKMKAVAELLVSAQAILMLQKKSLRLFEQLMIFVLLNCVVAAVFNDAFNYALFFLPLSLIGGCGLAYLAADMTADHVIDHDHRTPKESITSLRQRPDARFARMDTRIATRRIAMTGIKLPLMTTLLLFPAVILISVWFFFALPRRVAASRGSGGSSARVGFNDSLQMGDWGKMLQNTQRALRVKLLDPETQTPYPSDGEIYLRGRTLEVYQCDATREIATASWTKPVVSDINLTVPVPPRYVPRRSSDQQFFDRVNVEVTCEGMRSASLFATAPYYWIPGSEKLRHCVGRWTVERDVDTAIMLRRYPRTTYRFGTHAFFRGLQTRWTAFEPLDDPFSARASRRERSPAENDLSTSGAQPATIDELSAIDLDYLDQTLDYSFADMPSAAEIAEEQIQKIPAERQTSFRVARRLESYLVSGADYSYTLDLQPSPMPGMDAIERFLSVDRKGHCQYFASALVMMLRSRDIPARVVVGYRCDEFNDLAQQYTVRQSHAHAWVEALIPWADIPDGEVIYGQPRGGLVWYRLDPTPAGDADTGATAPRQVVDLAQDLWNDYVVDMDPERQRTALLQAPGLAPMTQSYRAWIDNVESLAVAINTGEVRGLGGGRLFSTPAAFAAIAFGFLAVVLIRLRWPAWRQRRRSAQTRTAAPRPSLEFYAETLDLMEEAGWHRQQGQTPFELVTSVAKQTGHDPKATLAASVLSPLRRLTEAFYQLRYGASPSSAESEETRAANDSVQAQLLQLRSLVTDQPESGT